MYVAKIAQQIMQYLDDENEGRSEWIKDVDWWQPEVAFLAEENGADPQRVIDFIKRENFELFD